MKFGVIVFPGSNCDQDMLDTLTLLGKKESIEVVSLWHKDHDLKACDVLILPGGFSYGDYLRSGAIARFSPIMEEVIRFANAGGLVFGICNGFQILCEAHLLPGALLHNNNHQFICKNVFIKPITDNSAITYKLSTNQVLKIPIAHGEGKYFADEPTLHSLYENNQILFKYCDKNGNITNEANPNGAIDNIAGICNKARNVFGMMPHPERASDPELGNTDGMALFESMLSVLEV